MRAENRLRRGADFQQVRATRRRWAHPLLVCHVRDRGDLGPPRVGIVVGRPVGKAVARNRVKRRIREILRQHATELVPGRDVVLVARVAAARSTFPELHTAVFELLTRGRLLVDKPPPTPNQAGGTPGMGASELVAPI